VQRGREDVAALEVSHHGARWLPTVVGAIAAQQAPVSCVVAVYTGSRDASRTLLS